MLSFRLCATLSFATLVVFGCSGGSSTGTGGTSSSSTGSSGQTTGTATTGAATTGTATTGTTGTATTGTGTATTGTGTGSGSTTSTGTGMSCMLHTSACGMCVGTSCQSEFAACQGTMACKNAASPGGSLDTCVCNAEASSMPTDGCFTTFDAMGATEKALGDCVQGKCKTPCGL